MGPSVLAGPTTVSPPVGGAGPWPQWLPVGPGDRAVPGLVPAHWWQGHVPVWLAAEAGWFYGWCCPVGGQGWVLGLLMGRAMSQSGWLLSLGGPGTCAN